MSILIDKETRLIIQGITGKFGQFMTRNMIDYGTNIVAGVVPGRRGTKVHGVEVFDTMQSAVDTTGANASLVLVPPQYNGTDAVYEAINSHVKLVMWLADPVPVHDMIKLKKVLPQSETTFVGPNSPGVISPGKCKIGFMPSFCYQEGGVGIISRSGSLSYEVALRLKREGIGQSTVVGIGGDSVKGLEVKDVLPMYESDEQTELILMLGEIGGFDEYQLIEAKQKGTCTKPIILFMVGKTAPKGVRLGHAGAIVNRERDTYAAKLKAAQEAEIPVIQSLSQIASSVKSHLTI